MSHPRVSMASMLYVGKQRLYLANGTAIAINGTLTASRTLLMSVETNGVRLDWGGVPTLTTGVLFSTNPGVYYIDGYNGTSKLTFQRDTGVCVVNLQGFKYKGDQ